MHFLIDTIVTILFIEVFVTLLVMISSQRWADQGKLDRGMPFWIAAAWPVMLPYTVIRVYLERNRLEKFMAAMNPDGETMGDPSGQYGLNAGFDAPKEFVDARVWPTPEGDFTVRIRDIDDHGRRRTQFLGLWKTAAQATMAMDEFTMNHKEVV